MAEPKKPTSQLELIELDLRKITLPSDLAFGDSGLVLSDEEVSVDTSPAEKLILDSKSKSGVVGACVSPVTLGTGDFA